MTVSETGKSRDFSDVVLAFSLLDVVVDVGLCVTTAAAGIVGLVELPNNIAKRELQTSNEST